MGIGLYFLGPGGARDQGPGQGGAPDLSLGLNPSRKEGIQNLDPNLNRGPSE